MERFWMWTAALGSLMVVDVAWTRPVKEDQQLKPQDVQLAQTYLRMFYSLDLRDPRGGARRTRSVSALEEKIGTMQKFFGLTETGPLDSDTLDVMRRPRCGVPDVDNFSFYPYRPKWKNQTITYTISQYSPDMSREEVERSFRLALKMWSDATPLSFVKVNQGEADIVLSFARRDHGDFSPFDGAGGVLAHAFQPGDGIGGDVHFDEDETWTSGSQA
ncbi:collagenase 3-like [Nematolebias whitei]|uniref:collagenase 3-like n=1 Tax=Nematolebias whitei TaxID=451745 RepID=UPI0018986F3F|nr:collagenase 3-like [Nematolebias whitei]